MNRSTPQRCSLDGFAPLDDWYSSRSNNFYSPLPHHVSTGADSPIKRPLLGHLQQYRLRLPRRCLPSAPAAKWVCLDQTTHGRFGVGGEMRVGRDEWDRSSVYSGRRDQFDGARLQRHAVVRLRCGDLDNLRSSDLRHPESPRSCRRLSQLELIDIGVCGLSGRLVPTFLSDLYHFSSTTVHSKLVHFRRAASNVANTITVQLYPRLVCRRKHGEPAGVAV